MITLVKASQVPKQLLLLADPDWSKVQRSLEGATIYGYQLAGKVVGVLVLKPLKPQVQEIMVVAVSPSYQHRGIARALLQTVIKSCQQATTCEQLQIGTGNSSLRQLALYQRAGFEITTVWVNYFVDNYAEPIYENGIQCKSMVRLALNVKAG
ncbi:N-acetyltransferase [Lactiplantibacillus sp. WILCCON 0030]|uniref:N-acetyltransferase n=1 Tax=Lactiplantibacillus brownii TaxID=3069269 RepID=A0ABU1AB81_9LACO|nr:N-acetyltransferase [Lactiplantibacillus brownii]MDQ7938171.1 N-acetyltransferase [Lactiplantibacillus brownii]